jgi:hypothetical protein
MVRQYHALASAAVAPMHFRHTSGLRLLFVTQKSKSEAESLQSEHRELRWKEAKARNKPRRLPVF